MLQPERAGAAARIAYPLRGWESIDIRLEHKITDTPMPDAPVFMLEPPTLMLACATLRLSRVTFLLTTLTLKLTAQCFMLVRQLFMLTVETLSLRPQHKG